MRARIAHSFLEGLAQGWVSVFTPLLDLVSPAGVFTKLFRPSDFYRELEHLSHRLSRLSAIFYEKPSSAPD